MTTAAFVRFETSFPLYYMLVAVCRHNVLDVFDIHVHAHGGVLRVGRVGHGPSKILVGGQKGGEGKIKEMKLERRWTEGFGRPKTWRGAPMQ